jgi:hypothetical protein
MTRSRRAGLGRWLLLAVVAVGVVLMHHAPAGEQNAHGGAAAMLMAMPASTTVGPVAAPAGEDGMGAMLHECLAVVGQVTARFLLALLLAAGLVLAAGLMLWRRVRPAPRAMARAPDQASGLGGRSLLFSVCVLRL